jgi:hypothetical protein
MASNVTPPSILSIEFHTKFFPQLLWSRLRPKKTEQEGIAFPPPMEFIMAPLVCVALAGVGLPWALNRGSIIGWILSIIGLGGLLAIFIFSILSQRGNRPTYDDFLIGVFFFFLFLGITAGICIGTFKHSLSLGLLSGTAGLFFGYVMGIFAGLWFQYLGWMAAFVNTLSGLAIGGMVIADLALLLVA